MPDDKKIICLAVDDEPPALQVIEKYIAAITVLELKASVNNAVDALSVLRNNKIDLIFLDIQMPGKTGFEMLQELDAAPHVIFVTAYDEYALKAFEVNALDYLLKPVEPKRLAETLQKLLVAEEKEAALANSHRGILTESDQVFVKDGERCWFVKLEDVRLFESVGNYAKVFFANNKPLILKSLNALEERLDDKVFFRANRKQIVNLRMVDKVEPYFNGGLLLELKAGEKVELSRRQAVKFKEMMSL